IREVFINLIDNAIKYTPEGSVSVGIEKKGKNEFHYYVKDTGVGVAPSEAGKLFNKFVRGSDIALVQPDGSGLGLFIVKRVVEGHNGKVWAESEGLGKGTTFHVVISLKQKDKLHQIEKETVFRSTTKLKEDKKKHNKTKPSTKAKIRKSTKPKK
ncbi:MAG: ATP-binding protein, partial [bacterium]|nr:ATP-binding protein [bacterium]